MHRKTIFVFLLCTFCFLNAEAQWTWRNPLPQGNDLHVIRINPGDQSVWAAGFLGTVVHSDDEGNNWSSTNLVPHTKYVNFIGLDIPDNSTLFAVDQYGYVFRSTDAGMTWDSVYYETEVYLHASCFTSSMKGYIAGEAGKIIRTDDGGTTWYHQHVIPALHFRDITFPSSSIGYVCDYCKILKTTDEGLTWNLVFHDSLAIINSMVFTSPSVGFVAGNEGHFWKTQDGGATWSVQHLGDTIQFWSIGAFSPDSLILIGLEEGTVNPVSSQVKYRSFNGGNTWTRLQQTSGTPCVRAVACQPGGRAYAAGYFGGLIKTEDYGANWATLSSFLAPPTHFGSAIYGMDFPSAQTGYAVTGGYEMPAGYIIKTTDGGATWAELDTVFDLHTLNAVDFITEDTGFVAGDNIYSTWDGGATWVGRSYNLGWRGVLSISFADFLNGVAVGEDGLFLRSTDRGQSWGQIPGLPNVNYWAVQFADNLTGFAAGGSVILKTTNAGASWTQVCDKYSLNSLYFVDTTTGIGVGNFGLIIRTIDGGATWHKLFYPGEMHYYAVHFYDADTGYVTGESGMILKTTDGGLNWQLQSQPSTNPQYAVRTTGNCVFTGGWYCSLFGTTNGGIPVHSTGTFNPPTPMVNIFPNPFSDQTQIRYTLDKLSEVDISFYDSRGIEISRQTRKRQQAGIYTMMFPSAGLCSGLYLCRIRIDSHTEIRKIVLVK